MKPIIRTFTGKEINPFEIRLGEICIDDIAHGLALCNRFAGQTRYPISVAQHSVYCSRLCGGSLQALLHDASEAYLGDVTKWVKQTPEMAQFRIIEHNLEKLIFQKFGCEYDIKSEVEEADRIMVRFEGLQGFGSSFFINHPNYPLLTKRDTQRIGSWKFINWRKAEEMFLNCYRELTW